MAIKVFKKKKNSGHADIILLVFMLPIHHLWEAAVRQWYEKSEFREKGVFRDVYTND